MKPNGIKIFSYLFLSLFVVCSCNVTKLLKANKIDYDYYTYYSNAILNKKISFFGDYIFTTQKIPFKNIDSSIVRLWKKNEAILFNGKTKTSPFINCIGFVIKKQKIDFYKSCGFINFKKDILVSRTFKRKDKAIVNWVIPALKYDICLYTESSLIENIHENYSFDFMSKLLREEFEEITSSSKLLSDSLQVLENPFNIAQKVFAKIPMGDYIAPVILLKEKQEMYLQDSSLREVFLQCISTYCSFLGDSKSKNEYLGQLGHIAESQRKTINLLDFNYSVDEQEFISQISKNQVVMFNESHFHPMNRYLISYLLPKLKSRGFKYIALEALNENAKILNKRGYPTIETGFYSREYHMANLIRFAIKNGFIIVDYEDFKDGNREYNQAKNLYEKTIKKDSNAKVIVLAGFSHIDEGNSGNHRWMASYFKEISNINPFTINQTRFNESKTNSPLDSAKFIVFKEKTSKTQENDVFLLNNFKEYNTVLVQEDLSIITLNIEELFPHSTSDISVKFYITAELKKCNNPLPCFSYYGNNQKIEIKIPDGFYTIQFSNNLNVNKKLEIQVKNNIAILLPF